MVVSLTRALAEELGDAVVQTAGAEAPAPGSCSSSSGQAGACRQRCPGWPVRRILRIPADTGKMGFTRIFRLGF